MNTRIDAVAVGTLTDLRRAWVVYSIHDAATAAPLVVGIAPSRRPLFDAPTGVDSDRPVIFRIMETLPDRAAAVRRQGAHAAALGVALVMATAAGGKARSVRCVETGQVWATAAACADDQGIDPAALSRHLRGAAGHNSVRGRRYVRIVVDNNKQGE